MTPERWQLIKEVLHRVLECPPEQRAAFLEKACGNDEELRREIESLLSADQKAGHFLRAPALVAADSTNTRRSKSVPSPTESPTRSARAPWWMYIVAASFIGVHALNPYVLIKGPNDIEGFLAAFDGNAMRVQAVDPGSRLAQAGLRTGDRVTTIDGHPVRHTRDWEAVQANMAPHRLQTWNVVRGPEQFEFQIPVEQATLQNRLKYGYLGYSITALGCLILGVLIGFKRPADPVARLGAWFILTASIAFGLPTGWAVPWRQLPLVLQSFLWIPQISRFVAEGIVLSLFVIFPRRLFHSRWPWIAIWVPVLATLPWRIASFNALIYPTAGNPALPGWLNQAIFLRTMLYLAAGIGILLLGYRTLSDINERRRVRVLITGTAVSFVAAIFLTWFFNFLGKGLGFESRLWEQLGFLALLTCPFAFYYAIIRHRVFDIHVVIRQGLQYALARRAILAVVPILVGALMLDLALNSQEPLIEIMQARGWIYGAFGGFVLLSYWQRKHWLDALDRRFFRERYDADRLLRGVVKEIRESGSFENVSPRVVTRVETALHPEFASVMVREPDSDAFYSVACIPSGKAPPPIQADSKLVGLVRVLGKPVEVLLGDSTWLERRVPDEEVEFLRDARIDLLIPVSVGEGGPEALMVLGIKRSEEPYTRQDQELLDAIATSLSLLLEQPKAGIENARSTFGECPDCGACYETAFKTCTKEGAALIRVGLPLTLAKRYRLDRRLGRGGMGTVYEAMDTALERRVAVKVIREDLVHSVETAQRFRRESRAAAGFSHPNVVTVYDYGVEWATRAFLVMELLKGSTLRDQISRLKRLPPDRTVEIMSGVCAAMDAAHNRRLIHRDLKPENIFLVKTEANTEVVKVLDFGIAKLLVPDEDAPTQITAQTDAGVLVGTPAYMSSEQLLGESPSVLWDLWALAVVAYEALAGALPFSSALTPDGRRNVISGNFTPVGDYVPEAPPAWQAFFEECFAADRSRRPASVADFCRKLEYVCGVPLVS